MASKRTKPIIIDRNESAFALLTPNDKIGKEGWDFDKTPYVMLKNIVAREAYSGLVPALMVTHILDRVDFGGNSPLAYLKFHLHRFKPRVATEAVLRKAIEEAVERRSLTVSPEAIEVDVKHLLAEPSNDEIDATFARMNAAA